MRTAAVVFMSLFVAFSSYGQTPRKLFDATTCAKILQTPPLHVPEECYPAQTFDFSGHPSPAEMQETVTILRTIMDFGQVSVDASAPTVTVHGSPEKLAMTEWLLRQLDQPAPKTPSTRKEQYLVPAAVEKELGEVPPGQRANDGVMSVFFLAHTENGRGVQQLLTVLRTVGDIQKVFNDTARTALAVRCPAAQMALAEYIINALDIAPETATAAPEFPYKSREGTNDVVRVFYLPPATVPTANQQILTALRNVVEIKMLFNSFSPEALVVRGSADEIAAADWLIQSLETKPSSGPREFRFAGTAREDNVMRVFYQPHAKIDTLKSSTFDSPAALLVRGSASQVAAAEQLMQ
jgi:hypothetical protein